MLRESVEVASKLFEETLNVEAARCRHFPVLGDVVIPRPLNGPLTLNPSLPHPISLVAHQAIQRLSAGLLLARREPVVQFQKGGFTSHIVHQDKVPPPHSDKHDREPGKLVILVTVVHEKLDGVIDGTFDSVILAYVFYMLGGVVFEWKRAALW